MSKFTLKHKKVSVRTVLPARYGRNLINQMSALARNYEIISRYFAFEAGISERPATGNGITRLSFGRLHQYSGVINRCEYKILASTGYVPPLIVRSRSSLFLALPGSIHSRGWRGGGCGG